jgi:inosine/xanthosine triphosphatase
MKILIATKNPTKIEGAKRAFLRYFDDFEIEGIPVSSDVSDEPVNDEVLLGAKNRVSNLKKYAKENNIDADYYIAIESGITNQLGEWLNVNMAVIEDKNGKSSVGSSSGFPIPEKYVDEIISTDLGKVMDRIFNETELRSKKGGISLLTKDSISRYDLTEQAFIMGLTKFINGNLWE